MTKINAYLDDVSPYASQQHPTESAHIAELVAYIESCGGEWRLPPILCIEDEGNGVTILDGHHRCAAARQLGIADIPSWVVSVADYCHILEADFDGCAPSRLSDLDEHIIVEGHSYSRE